MSQITAHDLKDQLIAYWWEEEISLLRAKLSEQAETIADLSLLLSHRESLIKQLSKASENARAELLECGFDINSGAVAMIEAALTKQEPK